MNSGMKDIHTHQNKRHDGLYLDIPDLHTAHNSPGSCVTPEYWQYSTFPQYPDARLVWTNFDTGCVDMCTVYYSVCTTEN